MSRLPRNRRRGRLLLGLLASVLAMIGVVSTPAAAAPKQDPSAAKIEPAVTNSLAASDNADFFVLFRESADLSGPSHMTDWVARGAAVVDALKQTADASQAAVRADLDAQKVHYKSYYIANTILVKGGNTALAESLAKVNNVQSIMAPPKYMLDPTTPGTLEQSVQSVEWGLSAIKADQVWSNFGVRGEGITVASIDTGVDFRHPALVNKYRGNLGNGSFDHNYNWFDPAGLCPSPQPCDSDIHGTHTMGTMVGDDGAGNQIGVAPNAKWIEAAGCCPSTQALLDAGQWILAPTDLSGNNPRADKRPNIVNNSWGSTVGTLPTDPFYKATVAGWRASGIFPAFSNGNSGPVCESSGSPGDYVDSFSSGAFDINGNIASFSSRGPGENGGVKPNLSAPGVNVRSSEPNGQYGTLNGTSMASPHTAGTVALMWSAAPSLVGDIAQTEAILNQTAVDTSDLSCGGTPGNNNVWGQGKLDALAAVTASPRGDAGTLAGTITDATTGAPLSGVSVHVTGASTRDSSTGADGRYSMTVPVGDYTVTASKFAYATGTGTGTVTANATTTVNIALSLVTNGTVSGHVRNAAGDPVGNAKVELLGTPIAPVTSAADGSYSIPNVPLGSYQAKASGGTCYDPQTQALTVAGNTTLDFVIPNRHDTFGNICVLEGAGYVEGDTPLGLTGDDEFTQVSLPFEAFFYGNLYTTAFVGTNGHINFLGGSREFSNGSIPSTGTPNAAIYPFWDDLVIDGQSQVLTKTMGAAPNRQFLVEWRNAAIFNDPGRVDFEAVLSESGSVTFHYRNLNPGSARESGNSATVGIENAAGTDAFQYSFNTAGLTDGTSITFKVPANGSVAGKVTDFNDGLPLAGATVKAMQGANTAATTTSAADGSYHLRLLTGSYTLQVTSARYVAGAPSVTVGNGTTSTVNVALHTPRAELTGGPLSFLGQAGQLRTGRLTLASTSADQDLSYTLTSSASWLWTVPGSLTVPHGQSQTLTVRVDAVGLQPGVYHATVDLVTNAGRTPTMSVPVTLVVPAYRTGVDAGGTAEFTDTGDDAWVADQAWAPGGFGYVGPGFVENSTKAISGTDDDKLFQTQRTGMAAYRFDNLPAGTYQVELNFAELRASFTPGKRVFDVSINGTTVLPGYDIAAAVGTLSADRRTFTVTVPAGGTIEVFFGSRQGKQPPTINSLRLTHRPDM